MNLKAAFLERLFLFQKSLKNFINQLDIGDINLLYLCPFNEN